MKFTAIAVFDSSIRLIALAVLATVAIIGATPLAARAAEPEANSHTNRLPTKTGLHRILSNHTCPCGCGSTLPGGDALACFGCSVAKAEVSFIRENLANGLSMFDIVIALGEPALIEIFADYTDPQLGATWKRAQRIASEFDQHRVVLRAPAETVQALRALELAECARQFHHFSRVRDALVEYTGPWGREALLSLAEEQGLAREATRQCLGSVDVADQIAKDRQHADQRRIRHFPAVSVNRALVFDSEESIRAAVRKVVLDKSF